MDAPDPVVVLLERIERHLQQLLEATQQPAPGSASGTGSPWMNVKECAAYTGFSVQTLYDYVHAEIIPFSKPGGTGAVRFHRGTIDKWMAAYSHKGRTRHKIEVVIDTSVPPRMRSNSTGKRKEVPMEQE